MPLVDFRKICRPYAFVQTLVIYQRLFRTAALFDFHMQHLVGIRVDRDLTTTRRALTQLTTAVNAGIGNLCIAVVSFARGFNHGHLCEHLLVPAAEIVEHLLSIGFGLHLVFERLLFTERDNVPHPARITVSVPKVMFDSPLLFDIARVAGVGERRHRRMIDVRGIG